MKVIAYTDGASRGNPGPAGMGYVILAEDGRVLEERGEFLGRATNNEAEYRAAIAALEAAHRLGARVVVVRTDAGLLARQQTGRYRTKAARLAELGRRLQSLAQAFDRVEFEEIPRDANRRADCLANEAIDRALHPQRQAPGRDGLAGAEPAGSEARARLPPVAEQAAGAAAAGPPASRPAGAAAEAAEAGRGAPHGHGTPCLLRVRYGETDQMGVVYYANYLDWFTEARTELMRRRGVAYALLERRGIFLPVREAFCEYLRPARYDQVVAVYARITRLTRVRLDFAYEVRLLAEAGEPWPDGERLARAGTLLARGWTRHAFVDAGGRPFDMARRHPELWERLQRAAADAVAQDGSS